MKNTERLRVRDIEENRDLIVNAIHDSTYQQYLLNTGPLCLDHLPHNVSRGEAVRDCVDLFGWPSRADENLEQLPTVMDNEEFLLKLFADPIVYEPSALNHFMGWICEQPTFSTYEQDTSPATMYGRHPAIHRLYALAPNLIEPTNRLVVNMRQSHGGDTAGFQSELSLGVNNSLVTAMRMSHAILGKLVTHTDKRLQYQLTLPGEDTSRIPDVTSVRDELNT